MKIKIIKNTHHKSWYRDKIGEEFYVLEESKNVDKEKVYITHKGRIFNSYVLAKDCEIVEN